MERSIDNIPERINLIKFLRKLITKKSTGKTVLILFLITNFVYLFMLTFTIPRVMEYAGGMKLLDMMPGGYDSEYVNELFAKLDENGRNAYLYHQIPVDMIYPLLFCIGYCSLFVWFLKKINQHDSIYFYFSFLPIIAGASDYFENIGIITMLKQFPDYSPETVAIANTFSMFKSSTTTIYFFALLIVMVVFVFQYIKSKNIVTEAS